MKKFMLYGSLVTFLFNPLYAVTEQPLNKTDNKAASAANSKDTQPAVTSDSSTNSAADKNTTAASNNNSTAPVSTPTDALAAAPAQADSTPPAATVTEQTPQPAAAPSTTPAPAAAQAVNCSYRIAPDVTEVDEKTIKQWATQAALQSFQFDYAKLDSQLSSLQLCYTEQGWQSFQDALTKSGNMEAIKNQQLSVNSVIDGESSLVQLKKNQWKVTLPLQATYQNGKEKLTQSLTIDLVIGRKISGDLGIMQIIASPRKEANTPVTPAAAPATTSSSAPTTSAAPAASAPQPTANH